MKKYLSLIATAALLSACSEAPTVSSPDGTIKVDVSRDGSSLSYAVTVGGDTLIAPSHLGFVADGLTPAADAKMTVKHTSFDQTWTQPWGENKEIRNHYNEVAVTLTDDALEYTVRVRAFDDGVAFRYEWNLASGDSVVVRDELTEFAFARPAMSWAIPANFDTYELEYRNVAIDDVTDANTPFTFEVDSAGIFGSIHEAALYDYPEMTLVRTAGRTLKANLAPLPDGVKAYLPSAFATPWRSIQLGKSACDLINSGLILNLNEPSKIADTSWIKPQKYVGIWWGMHLGTMTWTMGPRHGATTENAIRYIDFAAENNLQGVLFEGWNEGWDTWGGKQHFNYAKAYADFDIDSIAAYAASKGIELWAHNETGGNIPEYEAAMDSTFAYYKSLGIHTLKTGYAGGYVGGQYHHSQYGVKHYQLVVETAAKYELMVDAHEPIKETGIRRTWPNMMTREGGRGMEWNAWSGGNTPEYLCTLPFVRLLSGPMDYTPGIFDINYERAKADPGRIEWNGRNDYCKINTTVARQIANWVIIYSPLQMAADLIENYEGQPAFQFFRDFNADCDWSQALQGEIGKYIAVVRRAGDNYYLGAGTDSEARTLTVPLSFLGEGTYTATVYADDPADATKVVISSRDVTAADTLTVEMAAAGGQAVTFLPGR